MKKLSFVLAVFLLCGAAAAQQAQSKAPIASNPVVDLSGKITRVQVAPGQGMPYLELESAGKTSRILLGSMRYLMQNDFNPKAGMQAEVKGYQAGDQVVAIRVNLPSENKALNFRDENGWPLWMGGRQGRRGGMRGGMGGGMRGWRGGVPPGKAQ